LQALNLPNPALTSEKIKKEGVVSDALPDAKFRVKLDDGREIFAYLSGKMRMNYIRVMIGDKVTVEVSPDGSKGRIIYRK
jgi:translation initiation factor IF-1